jgi:structural maintenance of chromosomes protein 5
LLGRATSVAEFVKRGEESGHIKITLRGEHKEDHITIMPKISISNKSEWFLKGGIFNTRYTILLNAALF